MQSLPDLERLTEAEKLELIRNQHAALQQAHADFAQLREEIERLKSRIAALENLPITSPATLEKPAVPPPSAPRPSVRARRRRRRHI